MPAIVQRHVGESVGFGYCDGFGRLEKVIEVCDGDRVGFGVGGKWGWEMYSVLNTGWKFVFCQEWPSLIEYTVMFANTSLIKSPHRSTLMIRQDLETLVDKIRISGFPNEAEDCEALVIEGKIPRAREASKIRDILDNTAQNTKHGKGRGKPPHNN
ncbi:hypothetical protein Tco_1263174 [Tanacetum coccineum]